MIKKKNIIICILISLVLITIFFSYNKDIAVMSNNKISKDILNNMEIILGGEAIGIKLLATGVLVVGFDRYDTDLNIGDIILEVNNNKIETNEELIKYAKQSKGENLKFKINRQGDIKNINILPIFNKVNNDYKLGLWVKDSSAGVGTITFYNKKNLGFAALGHAITETKENYILPIDSGGITKTSIYGLDKGYPRKPRTIKREYYSIYNWRDN